MPSSSKSNFCMCNAKCFILCNDSFLSSSKPISLQLLYPSSSKRNNIDNMAQRHGVALSCVAGSVVAPEMTA